MKAWRKNTITKLKRLGLYRELKQQRAIGEEFSPLIIENPNLSI